MTVKKGNSAHIFGRMRPSQTGAFPVHLEAPRDVHFRDLPEPPGKAPYHLDIADILPKDEYKAIVAAKKLTFHVNGDMGGIQYAVPQQLVAKGMEADFNDAGTPPENPAFLYITGDCVYFNGEPSQYYSQFYQPYEFYKGPIFAVPGNHDGENLANGETLDGFLRNFCSHEPVKTPDSGDSQRTAMIQPNVYWTLVTPLVNIVGLYSNVPEGGEIRAPQTEWLVEQLKTLPKSVPLLIALHHPTYSADDHHSGSTHMKQAIEDAVAEAGRAPDMVIAGHVHNYQRITKNEPDGTIIPYLVTGAGGYHNLHHVMKVDGESMIAPVDFADKNDETVTLERYSDDHHGFLRLEVTPELIVGRYYTVPRPQEPWSKGSQMIDYFEFDWRAHKYVRNLLRTGQGAGRAHKKGAHKA